MRQAGTSSNIVFDTNTTSSVIGGIAANSIKPDSISNIVKNATVILVSESDLIYNKTTSITK